MTRSPGILHGADCIRTLQWRHNERDGISNHQPRDCLLNHLFRCRSKKTWKLHDLKTSKLPVTGLCEGNSPVTVEFPNKGPVTRKMFPFDDVIMHQGQSEHILKLLCQRKFLAVLAYWTMIILESKPELTTNFFVIEVDTGPSCLIYTYLICTMHMISILFFFF